MNSEKTFRLPVLYVESHPVHAMLMQALFERRPALRLLVANSGQEAMDMVDGLNPALLLLDLNLPDCRGERLLPVLRQQPGCDGVPAVAVAAQHPFDLEGTGFVEFWTQPLHVSYVLGRLDRLVEASPRGGGNGTPQQWSSGAAIPAGMRF